MHQTVHTAEIDERAEVDDRGHDTLSDGAFLQVIQELAAHLGLGLLQPGATGQHHVVAVLVQLDDLGLDLLADVGLQVAHPAHLHQRGGQETAQPDVEDQATLDDLDDRALDGLVLLLERLDGAPGTLVLRAFLGRMSRPSLSSLVSTRASTSSPTETTSLGSTSCLMDSSRAGITPSVL